MPLIKKLRSIKTGNNNHSINHISRWSWGSKTWCLNRRCNHHLHLQIVDQHAPRPKFVDSLSPQPNVINSKAIHAIVQFTAIVSWSSSANITWMPLRPKNGSNLSSIPIQVLSSTYNRKCPSSQWLPRLRIKTSTSVSIDSWCDRWKSFWESTIKTRCFRSNPNHDVHTKNKVSQKNEIYKEFNKSIISNISIF